MIINFAENLELNYSIHSKNNMMEVVIITMAIKLQYINVSNYHVAHLTFTMLYAKYSQFRRKKKRACRSVWKRGKGRTTGKSISIICILTKCPPDPSLVFAGHGFPVQPSTVHHSHPPITPTTHSRTRLPLGQRSDTGGSKWQGGKKGPEERPVLSLDMSSGPSGQ